MQAIGEALKPLDKLPQVQEAKQALASMSAKEQAEWLYKHHLEADAQAYQSIINGRRKEFERFSVWGMMGKQLFSFDKWHPELQKDKVRALEIKRQAWKLAELVLRGAGRNITVAGEPGTGKTALVLAMINHIQEQSDKTVMFISIATIAEKLHQFRDEQVQRRVQHIKQLMQKADVLVIDDFGTEVANGSASDTLQRFYFEIGEARQARDENGQRIYTTIITTNLNSKDIIAKYDPKVVSRLISKKAENQLKFKGLEDVRE
ncbi:AAA family ATPase [Convivina intestini]|uniref:AAA family ATPase n=1 Tax=Convivina intestini TaxID=1505726 RepID=UPI002010A21A|nr:AAA family ATPase [Convivina intestini]CAH1857534.1 hypothetical protein R077811_01562 [Convivina intestini]